tara:strand:+ start:856 stop:960 length:105 start_codon:yes stop_codon:yes gene_type:complete
MSFSFPLSQARVQAASAASVADDVLDDAEAAAGT